MKIEYKYIRFELIECKPKTDVYAIRNINSLVIIGYISWNRAWRQYCFDTQAGMTFSASCLNDISDFIKQLMDKRNLV